MFRNPADGLRADRAPGTVGAARRRRDRRLRAFLKHERMSVAMNMATIQHHSYMKSAVVDFCVQVGIQRSSWFNSGYMFGISLRGFFRRT